MILLLFYVQVTITQLLGEGHLARTASTNLNIKIVWTLSVGRGNAGLDRLDPGLSKFL